MRTLSTSIGEDIIPHVHLFRQTPWQIFSTVNGSFLLSRLPLLVLFFFIWRVLTVIICHIDLISELDAKGAALDPGCFWLQWYSTWRQTVENVVVDTGDHIRWLDEGEAERRSQMDCRCSVLEWCLNESKLVAEA